MDLWRTQISKGSPRTPAEAWGLCRRKCPPPPIPIDNVLDDPYGFEILLGDKDMSLKENIGAPRERIPRALPADAATLANGTQAIH